MYDASRAAVIGLTTSLATELEPRNIHVRLVESARVLGATRLLAPATLILIVVLYTIDNLLNGLVNPIFTVVAGALSAACAAEPAGAIGRSTNKVTFEKRSFGVRRQLWPPVATERSE